MNILLSVLAVAFAAVCVWLGVRIVNRRERWARWTLAGTIIGIPILYVLSFGPWCWLMSRSPLPIGAPVASSFYVPILRTWFQGDPEFIGESIYWLANLASKRELHAGMHSRLGYVLILN